MSAHETKAVPTPGPWRVEPGKARVENTIWTADNVRCVAQMVRSEDASLMADAPALLDALERLLRDYVADNTATPAWQNAVALLRKHGRLP